MTVNHVVKLAGNDGFGFGFRVVETLTAGCWCTLSCSRNPFPDEEWLQPPATAATNTPGRSFGRAALKGRASPSRMPLATLWRRTVQRERELKMDRMRRALLFLAVAGIGSVTGCRRADTGASTPIRTPGGPATIQPGPGAAPAKTTLFMDWSNVEKGTMRSVYDPDRLTEE